MSSYWKKDWLLGLFCIHVGAMVNMGAMAPAMSSCIKKGLSCLKLIGK